MEQKVQDVLIDAIDGGEAQQTVEFSLDGTAFEIDLNDRNAEELRSILSVYLKAGRRTDGTDRELAGRRDRAASVTDTAAIRAWAKENGYIVRARGRISTQVRAAYEAAAG
ncbi:Lsr2 family protein [Streptomyces sp. NPDC004787]|uniref:histone-like nucleoid-structuring protein Lsr2 n=1 Tax=Streptomyces sp. NPDC004787 TaxID=3154291 RepID=UPI0033B12B81